MEKWVRDILAQKAYEAFHKSLDETVGKSGMGRTIPFDEVSDETKNAWGEVVREILCSYPLDLSQIDKDKYNCRG